MVYERNMETAIGPRVSSAEGERWGGGVQSWIF